VSSVFNVNDNKLTFDSEILEQVRRTKMIDPVMANTGIALDEFLPIFIYSTLVLVFGGFYVGIYTAVKVKVLKKWFMPLAYVFWLLTTFSLYKMGVLMNVNEFTAKALIIAMIGYLLLPHAIYYMQDQVHEENEHEPESI